MSTQDLIIIATIALIGAIAWLALAFIAVALQRKSSPDKPGITGINAVLVGTIAGAGAVIWIQATGSA